jgi:small-conductance mechanosensitive channel
VPRSAATAPAKEALVSSKLGFAIDRAFRANHIGIPVPQREIHVHPRDALP